MIKKTVVMVSALLCVGLPLQARHYRLFDEPFLDGDWMDCMMEAHAKAFDRVRSRIQIDGEAMKNGPMKTSKVTYEVTEDADRVTIVFSGFENLSKDEVKVVKKPTGWFGTLTNSGEIIEFFLSEHGIQVTSRIEVKKEEILVPQNDKKSEETEKAPVRASYSLSTSTDSRSFPSSVCLDTVKGEPVTPTGFTLVVDKQKEHVLPIS